MKKLSHFLFWAFLVGGPIFLVWYHSQPTFSGLEPGELIQVQNHEREGSLVGGYPFDFNRLRYRPKGIPLNALGSQVMLVLPATGTAVQGNAGETWDAEFVQFAESGGWFQKSSWMVVKWLRKSNEAELGEGR